MYRWIKEASKRLPKYQIEDNIAEIEFDEMWHFIKSKKTNYGLLRLLTKEQEERLHGNLEIVIQKLSKNYMIK